MSLKEGDVRYYKWPDRWGSPIERAVVKTVGERSSWVDMGGRIALVPNHMLFKFATIASEWAERQVKSLGQSIFGEFNQKRRQCDFNFTAPRPVVEATGSPTLWVVQGNGGSLFVVDSPEAAEAVSDWLFTTTGQRSSVRATRVHTLKE